RPAAGTAPAVGPPRGRTRRRGGTRSRLRRPAPGVTSGLPAAGVRLGDQLHLVRTEVPEPAEGFVQVSAGIAVHDHGQVAVVLHVEQHRPYRGGTPPQEDVLGVRPSRARLEPYPAAPGGPAARHFDLVRLR